MVAVQAFLVRPSLAAFAVGADADAFGYGKLIAEIVNLPAVTKLRRLPPIFPNRLRRNRCRKAKRHRTEKLPRA